jgi:hypothetical protein
MLLYRQIHPDLIKKATGIPSPSNFKPEDGRTLSTRREGVGDAKAAHDAHLAKGKRSAGTWAFTVAEAYAATVDDEGNAPLCAYDDETDDDPYHVSVWFPEGLRRTQIERLAKALYNFARSRGSDGWLYGPVPG